MPNESDQESTTGKTVKRKRSKIWTKLTILIRRIHLYAGLFLLPWVFLYGITGAMYNHMGLFPEAAITPVPFGELTESNLEDIPTDVELAKMVVEQLQAAAPDSDIRLADNHQAAFNNEIIFQVNESEGQRVIHIDPVSKNAQVAIWPHNPEAPERLLPKVKNLQLTPNPYETARSAAPLILEKSGHASSKDIKPRGWCKLNFLAEVDGQMARVTYVLRDGHVDVEKYDGNDGMTPRQFIMRLHTSHGQPPYWNGRMFWSVILDAMAIAMVSWGVTGVIMWWTIKRTRFVGGIVIAASVCTAFWLYFSMMHFYATTKL